jgi:hypothetical protein
VVQEQFDEIPLQHGEQLLVQLEDDLPYNLAMILHSDFVLQGDLLTNHCLDIKTTHDPIEMEIIKVFCEVDLKCFGSYTFLLITTKVPCSKFQLTIFIDFLSSKHMNAYFYIRRLHD